MELDAITAVISLGGLALLALMGVSIFAQGNARKLNKHRSTNPSYPDLLNAAALIADGVCLNKDGSMMAAWVYRGADNNAMTSEQQEVLSAQINLALSKLGNGWMFHIDAVRRPAQEYTLESANSFGDSITTNIEAERRRYFEAQGQLFEGYFVLTVSYFPPRLAKRKFVELMFTDDNPDAKKKTSTSDLLRAFERDITSFEDRLSAAFSLSRLKGFAFIDDEGEKTTDDFLRWLQFCTTGKNHPVMLPNNPMYLDGLIGAQEFYAGTVPRVGEKFIQVVALDGLPSESTPGMLTVLGELKCQYRWSTRFIYLETHAAKAHFEKYRRQWKQKIRGFADQVLQTNGGPTDLDAASMVVDADEGLAEINSGVVSHGYLTSVVVLMHEDRGILEASARQVVQAVNLLGFGARIETLNTVEAFLGSIPGHGVENVRRPLINTMNLADLMPSSSIWTGEQTAPCPFYPPSSPSLMHAVTSGSTPFRLNLHVGDVGHTLMVGPTGAGKSTHLALIAAQLRRYEGMTVYCFDKGESLFPLAAAINADTKGATGQHFAIASETEKLAFAPLQFLDTDLDRAWAVEWLETMLNLNGVTVTPDMRNSLFTAIKGMQASNSKTLTEFCLTVQNEQIREALQQYTVAGSQGHLLDAEKDGLDLSDFTVFEVEELMELGEKYALPILLYLFRRIEKSLQGQPAAILLDEAWLLLGHPVFKEKIREWLKVMRKANCLVLLATQSISDVANSGIMDVVVESTASKIVLPNPQADDDEVRPFYESLGLNRRQIATVATAEAKRQYFYHSVSGRRLYELALGDYALAFLGRSDKESRATIRQLQLEHGNGWPQQWLKLLGVVEGREAA